MFHGDIQRHADVLGEGSFPPEPLGRPAERGAQGRRRSDPALARADDTALMAGVAAGDAAAFAQIVDRHVGALYRVAMRMLGDAQEAEDVVQEAFARVWQQAPRWQPSGAGLVGWLHRVTINLCFDRKRRFRVVLAPELPEQVDEAPLADAAIVAEQARAEVARTLADLPERYRAALVLCYYEGLSNALAAEVLELNIKAMESLLFRARRHMRDLLEKRDVRCLDLVPASTAA
ncbi:RNA polymerase sigma factor [Novosphingobium huizhouense]|uniref:RNA polymerase sigma factor n=1 Tax=Novosphingobium huizhouense TaxID=2866625 RepID=UPI001CD90487|nr:RNA polymerase sigma factor [Novosphingobium huizhouense]